MAQQKIATAEFDKEAERVRANTRVFVVRSRGRGCGCGCCASHAAQTFQLTRWRVCVCVQAEKAADITVIQAQGSSKAVLLVCRHAHPPPPIHVSRAHATACLVDHALTERPS